MVDGLALTVLLRHELPDGSIHYDWLLEDPAQPQGPLLTFRVHERLDLAGVKEFEGVRLPNHRREYLTYEGEVSGNRGRVTRVAQGQCEVLSLSEQRIRVGVIFEVSQVWDGRREDGDRWVFHATPG
jgi:hypothetical protein